MRLLSSIDDVIKLLSHFFFNSKLNGQNFGFNIPLTIIQLHYKSGANLIFKIAFLD